MSQVRVNVSAPGEIPVPNTGAFTYSSGTITGGNNAFYTGVGVTTAIALVVILPILLVRKGMFKNPVSGFSIFSKKKLLLLKILTLALISFGVTFSTLDIVKHYTTETNAARTRNITDTLTITAEDLEINIGIDSEPVYKSAASVITVETSTEAGYTLSAYASNPDFVAEENPDSRISGLTASGLTTLSENTWGISLTAPESQSSNTWQAMPATEQNALILKSTDEATADGDQTTVYYGVYVNSDIPYGTYSGTVNYVAVANVSDPGFTVNYHGNGMYFDEEKTEDVNTVRYSKRCGPVYGYTGQPVIVKTPNIDENGEQTEPYYEYVGEYDDENISYYFEPGYGYYYGTVSFPEAKNLKIEFTFDAGDNANMELRNEDISKDMYGSSQLISEDLIISGDHLNIFFDYWLMTDSETGNTIGKDENHNYGFYAKIYPIYEEEREGTSYQNNGEMCSWYVSGGQYKDPVDEPNKYFGGWESEDFYIYSNEFFIRELNSAGSEADILIDQVIDLNAVWEQVYQISYDANGGEGVMAQTHDNITEGRWITLYESGFSRNGYAFAGWNTEPDGTGENYYPNENIQAPAFPASGHFTLYANWIKSVGVMQNWSGCGDLSFGDVVALTDNRDNRSYIVQRLLDGNCWMMENLDLGRTELTTNLTVENTNLVATITASTFNGWKKTTGTATFDSGEFINLSGSDSTSGIAYGTLYNYYAASAGTISSSVNNEDASYDICPSGWRLPTGGDSGEFQALYNLYDSYTLMRTSITRGGIAFALTGYFSDGAPARQGDWGDYWSSTRKEDANMYTLFFRGSSVYPIDRSERNTASSIRCVHKPLTISNLTYMQDFKDLSVENKQSVIGSMKYKTIYNLIDNRDNKTYEVAKLKDGKIWMAENLDLGRTTLTTDLTSYNTNLETTVVAETFNGWKKTTGSGTYNSGEFISLSGTDETSGTAYGTLYNYYAASGGTYSGYTNSGNAQYDICPAGWRLPTGGGSGEFLDLYKSYVNSNFLRRPIETAGAALTLAGRFYKNAPEEQESRGAYWSSTRNSNNGFMYSMVYTNAFSATSFENRAYGYSMRCVAK